MQFNELNYIFNNEPADEQSFDKEKWKRDNPVDYLKMMYLLSGQIEGDKNIMFQALYPVTRMYLPDTLYKYYSLSDDVALNEKKMETLANKKIYLSELKHFNDPFDGKAYYTRPIRIEGNSIVNDFNGKLIDDFSSFHLASSLTENGVNSMPMWAHYGANHKGFCVSYQKTANQELFSLTFPVQYADQRIDVTCIMEEFAKKLQGKTEQQITNDNGVEKSSVLFIAYMSSMLSNIKHSSWKYEKEFRCSIGKGTSGAPFIKANPGEIYIGMNCNKKYADRLRKIGKSLSIPVFTMYFDEESDDFNLKFK